MLSKTIIPYSGYRSRIIKAMIIDVLLIKVQSLDRCLHKKSKIVIVFSMDYEIKFFDKEKIERNN